ncbi:uncharacterized protein LOC127836144 isoform X4 [Dreissena polymorpha]|uniref:uncharacterized protein LOC127836144 isoform X4 n=1 Tax=Dreissena polymorpha TaxID=45954 RepID=UPI002264235F|nr:uncharacterized protein LOC127836144 isoform X4 [Dreissena polymorpha]
MNKQSSGVNTFEKVFSDIRSAAKEMIPRMQEPSDMLEERTANFESSLRQAEKMVKDQDSHNRRLSERCCVLEAALNASQKSQISTDHCRELLPIAKSFEDICVKNEETFVKEMDLLQQEIARREEDIKKLNLSLQSAKSCSKKDRNKWQRQIETHKEHIIILKKKEKILQNRVNTLNETVEVLRPKSAVTFGVSSEPSHQLEQLIAKDAQLKQEYDKIQKELHNHDKLLSGHQDSPTTRGLSTLSTDKFENDEVMLRKHMKTSPMSLSSQPRPITLELLVSVDLQKTGDDEKKPLLGGLDFLPDGRLVAVDNKNMICIILNEQLQRLGTPYKFKYHPYNVVCVSHDALCVTSGGYKVVCLLSVSTDNTITLTREIKTSSKFDSICCMSPSNMVVSTYDDPRPVRMISVDGVESDFDHSLTFPMKTYKIAESRCTYVQSKNTLVLTDQLAHTVYVYDTVNGTSRAVTNENIQEPRGACVGPGDTVLVCSMDKNSIVHLSVDGNIIGTYPVDMKKPTSIGLSKNGTRLAVSNSVYGKRKLHLYKISPAMH